MTNNDTLRAARRLADANNRARNADRARRATEARIFNAKPIMSDDDFYALVARKG